MLSFHRPVRIQVGDALEVVAVNLLVQQFLYLHLIGLGMPSEPYATKTIHNPMHRVDRGTLVKNDLPSALI